MPSLEGQKKFSSILINELVTRTRLEDGRVNTLGAGDNRACGRHEALGNSTKRLSHAALADTQNVPREDSLKELATA